MATSARIQSLLEQRKTYRGISPDRRRVLSPNRSAGVSSIARQNTKAELEAMIDRYNNGSIGNEEMRSFLQSKSNDKYLSPSEKVGIQDQIADFDSRVEKDRLEAVFKKAAPNSMEQVQAAKALQSYYSNRAATMAEGTPAQSQNLENAAGWEQKAVGIEDTMQKTARKNFRYTKEAEINQLPNNSSERMYEKAQLYNDLANQANADGDAVEAQRLFAQAQQFQTTANEAQTREQESLQKQGETDSKNQVHDYLNNLQTQYVSGQIDANTYHNELVQAAPEIEQYGDTSLTLKVYKMIETAEKKSSSAQEKQAYEAWDKEDFNYEDNKKQAYDALVAGQINPKKFAELMKLAIEGRAQQLGQRQATVLQIAQNNPNSRLVVGGRSTQADDVLKAIYSEGESVSADYEALSSGNYALAIVPPKQFNSNGTLTNNSSVSKIQIVDKRNIPQDYKADDQGIYHQIQKKTIDNLEGISADGATYTDPNTGQSYPVQTDGNSFYYESVDVYEAGTPNRVSIGYSPGEKIPSWKTVSTQKQEKPAVATAKPTTQPSLGENIKSVARNITTNLPKNLPSIPGAVAQSLPVVGPVATVAKGIQTVSQNLPQVKMPELPKFNLPKINAPSSLPSQTQNFATNVLPSIIRSTPIVGPATGVASSAVKLAPQIATQLKPAVTGVSQNISNTLGNVGNTINQGVDWLKGNIKLPKLF